MNEITRVQFADAIEAGLAAGGGLTDSIKNRLRLVAERDSATVVRRFQDESGANCPLQSAGLRYILETIASEEAWKFIDAFDKAAARALGEPYGSGVVKIVD